MELGLVVVNFVAYYYICSSWELSFVSVIILSSFTLLDLAVDFESHTFCFFNFDYLSACKHSIIRYFFYSLFTYSFMNHFENLFDLFLAFKQTRSKSMAAEFGQQDTAYYNTAVSFVNLTHLCISVHNLAFDLLIVYLTRCYWFMCCHCLK